MVTGGGALNKSQQDILNSFRYALGREDPDDSESFH